jgi:hypothetical protein
VFQLANAAFVGGLWGDVEVQVFLGDQMTFFLPVVLFAAV